MPSLTQRLQLKVHTIADRFRTQDYTDNWNALDRHPGTFICTSTTRPTTWSTAHAGMFIFETDTRQRYLWDGDSFDQIDPRGSVARAERLSDMSTTSFDYVSVVATPATRVTDRRHLVIAEAPGVYSTQGLTGFALFRGETMLQEWNHQGWTGSTPERQPRPLSMVTSSASTAGTFAYSLRFKAVVGFGGTCTILGATNKPIAIHVVEV